MRFPIYEIAIHSFLSKNERFAQKLKKVCAHFATRAKREIHCFKKRERAIRSFCQKTSDWHEKSKSEFPTLTSSNSLLRGNIIHRTCVLYSIMYIYTVYKVCMNIYIYNLSSPSASHHHSFSSQQPINIILESR